MTSECLEFLTEDVKTFIILSALVAFGFLVTMTQLVIAKPTSKKALIPIVVVTSAAFVLLIAIDFFLEIRLTHVSPKEALTAEVSNEKGKSRFKTGYLIIYGEYFKNEKITR